MPRPTGLRAIARLFTALLFVSYVLGSEQEGLGDKDRLLLAGGTMP